MRLGLRLSLWLIAGITCVSLLFALYQVEMEYQSRRHELRRRTELLAETLQLTVERLGEEGSQADLQLLVDRFGNREHLEGVAIYDQNGTPLAMTTGLSAKLDPRLNAGEQAALKGKQTGEFIRSRGKPVYVLALPVRHDGAIIMAVSIFNDAAYIDSQVAAIWHDTALRVLVQMLLIGGITLLIVRLNMMRPIARLAQWAREARIGRTASPVELPQDDGFGPLTVEVRKLATSLHAAQASAEEEARLRGAAQAHWTAERLRVYIGHILRDSRLFVVSNREPYEHVHRGGSIEVTVPASGLVTALEPILRACDGIWIAQGAGDADRETADTKGRLRVPPDTQQYTLRRVWLEKDEEQGFYSGFSNEGIWPLCHIAHTRPIFRAEDWKAYRAVNAKFAEAALQEMEGAENPVVLLQDYHFALLPRLIKDRRPDARVAIFWHIPWPNPEAFGICPWQHELLAGLLGADLIGFHIQSHCNNFMESVDRTLECRLEWERFAINRGRRITLVRPFPISVPGVDRPPEVEMERGSVLRKLALKCDRIGVGVDRLDYTKGIPERLRGIESFLDNHPYYLERFTFIQVGAPSRTHIQRYQALQDEVNAEVARINERFATRGWKPIVFLDRHHSHEEIRALYRAADLCMVTSLHDGMNLVAKEFVASRDDDCGALILSQFTGASRELEDAIVVNPYDTQQVGEAIHQALTMDSEERVRRMRRMRRVVKEQNVYRWAADIVHELSEVRIKETLQASRERKEPAPLLSVGR
ncbi:MAG TPA: trehalose-6-phosphate synthase [Bryobacteraceae bacterium]|nr:trehalose-6-phosphate synthase [Bryobacteraceae bacterium]